MSRPGPLEQAFHRELEAAMTADGWTRADRPPIRLMPFPERWVRDIDDGWVATTVVRFAEGDTDLGDDPDLLASVTVDGGATFPAAERLAALLGAPRNLESAAPADPSATPEEDDGEIELEIRDPTELDGVLARIVAHAQDVVLPWTRAHAGLDAWRAEMSTLHDDDDPDGELVPTMLLAHGRTDEAVAELDRLDALIGGEDRADQQEFSRRFRAFVADGTEIPATAGALFVRSPIPELTGPFAKDELKEDFLRAKAAELARSSSLHRWAHVGGQLRRGVGALAALRDADRAAQVFDARWRSVPYAPEDEPTLAGAFASAGRAAADRVDLEVDLRPVDGGAEVRVAGRPVAVLAPSDVPVDVPGGLPTGPMPARLTRKDQPPRFLLEVRFEAPSERFRGGAGPIA
ncbi:hypothetical protein [Patulibacter minatonensis]|uniref:hypothetical protein n=1 Tax=Patulibacter minatonensis TaxID=298163 RepID=UPI00047DDBFA|nr:hypothetical protein [Patulibacter minatonensis]